MEGIRMFLIGRRWRKLIAGGDGPREIIEIGIGIGGGRHKSIRRAGVLDAKFRDCCDRQNV